VRNLPASVAGSALHPPIAVLVDGLQGEPEHGGIGLAIELALRRTAVADLQRIVPNTVVDDGIVVVLLSADTELRGTTSMGSLAATPLSSAERIWPAYRRTPSRLCRGNRIMGIHEREQSVDRPA